MPAAVGVRLAALASSSNEARIASVVWTARAARADDAELPYDEAKRQVLDRFQRRYLERLVSASEGNLSEAARRAGITRAALYRMMKRVGFEPPHEGALS